MVNFFLGIFGFLINIENGSVSKKKHGFNEERVISVLTGSEDKIDSLVRFPYRPVATLG